MSRLITETGAGQWGSALAFASAVFGLQCEVWQVRASYDQKPYRRLLMETYGATVHPSPSDLTQSGKAILAADPDSPGSLGIAISEAVEVAAGDPSARYALGSVLNHVLLHQTVIGEEAIKQMEQAGDVPDLIIGCTGGGSNFSGLVFPFLREKLAGRMNPVLRAVEPAACPSFTRGVYAYDFGDTAGFTPLLKMHTLGHDFVPDPIHAGGLRYHGMSPLLSHMYELGLFEAVAKPQSECFAAGLRFARAEGIVPCAGAHPRARFLHRGGAALQGDRRGEGHPDRAVRPRPAGPDRVRELPGRPGHRLRPARPGPAGRAQRPPGWRLSGSGGLFYPAGRLAASASLLDGPASRWAARASRGVIRPDRSARWPGPRREPGDRRAARAV